MGKKKRAGRALTQEEIWDDSALVQSWDEAVEEYRLYHSIHAKGENVEDVLREAEEKAEAEAAAEAARTQAQAQVPDEKDDDDMADADAVEPVVSEPHPVQPTSQGSAESSGQQSKEGNVLTGAPPMPHPVLNQVQDESLKNLMMSWYFAGYYTGLYEGQQRGKPER